MLVIYLILLIFALVFFVIEGLHIYPMRFNLMAMGLACVVLVEILRMVQRF